MKKKNLQGIIPGFAIAMIVAGMFFVYGDRARALPVEVTASAPQAVAAVQTSVWEAVLKAGRVSFANALRSLINQFAYDTATYVGSGAAGQKPVYFTKEFGPWLLEQGANAGGQFIEEFAKQDSSGAGEFINKYNICSPDLSVSIKISLGLTDYSNDSAGLTESRCNLAKIWQSGVNQVSSFRDPNYFKNLAENSFDPTTTDVGAALTLFNQIDVEKNAVIESKARNRSESGGWLDVTGLISGYRAAPPGTNEAKLAQATDLQTQGFFSQTGDIFVDAANIFLNQLALSAFNRLIGNLSRDAGGDSNSSYYSQGGNNGATDIARRNSSLLQAQFNERSDYDILSQLSSCANESKPGPTNCVITQQFAQAISQHLSVAEAIERGVLDEKKRIGFDEQGGDINYKDGYPYRSLIILRKYRILPVGWEVAAQYIKDYPGATRDVTLGDLVSCFDKNDSYQGFHASWCEGLVDPHWVLKIPKMFCGLEGYGPEILSQAITPASIGYCTDTDKSCNTGTNECHSNNVECNTSDDCGGGVYSACNFTYGQEVQVSRNQNYCADEQSCIKENSNGSCAYYGYCTEEKRLWKFSENDQNSCEARNNTCQSFKSSSGQEVSYLENTLDYGNCNANQVGCQRYATLATAYAGGKVTWNPDSAQRYFNKNITPCDAGSEGCHEFIRTKDDLDTNLIADGGFELSSCIENNADSGKETGGGGVQSNSGVVPVAHAQALGACQTQPIAFPGAYLNSPNGRWYIAADSGTVKAGIVTTQANQGQKSLYIEGNGGLYSKESGAPSILPAGFVMEPNTYYTVSASVYIEAGAVRLGFGTQTGQFVNWSTTGSWKTIAVVYYNSSTAPVNEFFLKGTGSGSKFYIDQIQFTKGRATDTYSDYGSANVIYEKLLPSYLEATCYTGTRGGNGGEFTLKADAPAECYKFARKCSSDEVGCESYTANDSGIAVTGKVKAPDYCPGSCVGYNTYVQQANAFNAKQAAYFIPSTARSCSAQSVGCTAFTNLDKLDQGGESVEYYSSMRSCMKPDATACGQFYTWEGSDDSGYQLHVYSLKRNGAEPATTISSAQEAALCNADVFKKLPSEQGYNHDCRQFYAADGSVSYHLYSKTITCSQDCHPFRREVASRPDCENNGGSWDSEGRCIYNAIPSEGTTCSAAEVGCQEYAGNISNNTRSVFNPSPNTFENVSNPLENWRGGTQSNVSLSVGGHSLSGSKFEKIVGEDVNRNNSYTISFLARAQNAGTTITQLNLRNKDAKISDFATAGASVGTDWKLYTFNLENLDHEVTARAGTTGELLTLQFSAQAYIDNIRLTEIPDRYYLIKNSWATPEECDRDNSGAASPQYMLGCSQYTKADQSALTLRSFTSLCQDSAAGCEAMIDTRNSTNPAKTYVNDTNGNRACDPGETDCVETPADAMINVVYDRTKLCDQPQKGCQRLGAVTTYDTKSTFNSIDPYLKNDPDQYSSTVCTAAGVSCSQFNTADGGTVYFKDPGQQVCEWRLKAGTSGEYGWLKKPVKRCGGTTDGAACSVDTQCAQNQLCTLVTEDIACSVSDDKTLGSSGNGKQIIQPDAWAGVCEPSQASCTEYIDPSSKSNINLIKNPTYAEDSSGGTTSFWNSEPADEASQRITLNTHTVYILKGNNGTEIADEAYVKDCRLDSNDEVTVYQLNSATNVFDASTAQLDATRSVKGQESLEFYVSPDDINNRATSVTCSIMRKNRIAGRNIELRQAIVVYQLEKNLDKVSPNGLTSFTKGNILFNERSQNGSKKAALKYNVDATPETSDGVPPVAGDASKANANVIIKAQSDRVCSKWLSCNTYAVDPSNPNKQQCLDVGLCDSFDSEGNCNNPIAFPTDKNQDIQNLGGAAAIANMTGYSKVGYRQNILGRGGISASLSVGYYNLANMNQVGAYAQVMNGGFEKSGSWTPGLFILNQLRDISTEKLNAFHVLKGSDDKTGTNLPPVGQGMAKLTNASAQQESQVFLSLSAGKQYVVSAYIYNKGASASDLILKYSGGEKVLLTTDQQAKNTWIHPTAGFTVPAGTNYQLKLVSRDGDSYFDDIKIESGLNLKCNGNDTASGSCNNPEDTTLGDASKKPAFISSICRLYPKAEALGCEYTDKNNVTNIGLKGYCLEYDPKSPDVCLMWYPLDKIQSDTTEEGVGLNFSDPIYYCDQYAPEPRYVYRIPVFEKTSSSARENEFDTACGGGAGGANRFYVLSGEGGTVCNGGDSYHYDCDRKDAQPAGWNYLGDNQTLTLNGDTADTGSIISSLGFNCPSSVSVQVNDPFVCSRITNNPNATSCTISDEILRRQFDDTIYYDHCAPGAPKCKSLSANFEQLKTPRKYCSRVVRVNNAKPWNARLRASSTHKVKCYTFPNNQSTPGLCDYSADAIPFGMAWLDNSNLNREPNQWQVTTNLPEHETENNALVWRPTNTGPRMGVTVEAGSSPYYMPSLFMASIVGDQSQPLSAVTKGSCVGGTDNGATCSNNSNCDSFNCSISYQGLQGYAVGLLPRCTGNARPEYDINNPQASYCYVEPTVSNLKIKGTDATDIWVRGAEELLMSFSTSTNIEQLPIKTITLNLGYKKSNGDPEAIETNGNYGDGTRTFRQVYDYSKIMSSNNTRNASICANPYEKPNDPSITLSCGERPCCVLKPKVAIQDNWGEIGSKTFNKYVVVEAN